VFAGCLSDKSEGAKDLRTSTTGRLHVVGEVRLCLYCIRLFILDEGEVYNIM
jgi:hypothetical protein